jgi:hypothetical protein
MIASLNEENTVVLTCLENDKYDSFSKNTIEEGDVAIKFENLKENRTNIFFSIDSISKLRKLINNIQGKSNSEVEKVLENKTNFRYTRFPESLDPKKWQCCICKEHMESKEYSLHIKGLMVYDFVKIHKDCLENLEKNILDLEEYREDIVCFQLCE